jgi:uncharacterized protein (TIGR00661 family)
MARIIYAVAGEGFGHSSRSHTIANHLIAQGHELIFAASNKSYQYLSQYFGDRVHEVFGLSFYYRNGNIQPVKTFFANMARLPIGNRINKPLFNSVYKSFAPDLVISDFEPFSAWWAWRKKIPFVSIDHEHLLSHCSLDPIKANTIAKLNAQVVTRLYYFKAAAYIVINFFDAPVKNPRVILCPPVIRKVVEECKPSEQNHIVLYSTTGKRCDEIISTLNRFQQHQFYLYGFDSKNSVRGNCTLKPRSTEAFLADLAASKGVIASSGFSLLSECLYLRKKMLLLPVAGQFEQILNAEYAQKLGLARKAEAVTDASVADFLDFLERKEPEGEGVLWPDNARALDIIDSTLSKIGIKPVTK